MYEIHAYGRFYKIASKLCKREYWGRLVTTEVTLNGAPARVVLIPTGLDLSDLIWEYARAILFNKPHAEDTIDNFCARHSITLRHLADWANRKEVYIEERRHGTLASYVRFFLKSNPERELCRTKDSMIVSVGVNKALSDFMGMNWPDHQLYETENGFYRNCRMAHPKSEYWRE